MHNKMCTCTKWAPCENIGRCLRQKPPLVLFTVGLCTLALISVVIASYIKDNTLVSDPNYHTNWGQFLTSLTSIYWSADSECVKNVMKLPTAVNNATSQVYISVYVDKTEYNIESGIVYQGTVWKEKLLPKELLLKNKYNITVSFNCVLNDKSECKTVTTGVNSGRTPLCLNISSDSPFLSSNLRMPETCAPSQGTVRQVYACDKSPSKPSFHTVYTKSSQDLGIYLDYNGRLNIHLHLMSASYVLFGLVAALLLYGFLKRRGHSSPEESGATFLPSDGEEV